MRTEQPEGRRGSLKWIQRLVERHPLARLGWVLERIAEQRINQITHLMPWNIAPLRADGRIAA